MTMTYYIARPLFKTVGELAFIEEDILIHNLFVYDLPENTTLLNITEYFEDYGRLMKVHPMGRRQIKKCLIYFVDPRDAAKVLRQRCFFFLSAIIRVEPCYGDRQPLGKTQIDVINETLKYRLPKIDEDALISTLNDDCLYIICKMLSIKDQLEFALTCQRFVYILEMCSRIDYRYFCLENVYGWSPYKIKMLLQIIGPHIKELVMECEFNTNVYNSIGSLCTNVQKLTINNCLNIQIFPKLVEKMEQLQELRIRNSNVKEFVFKHLTKLKKLTLLFVDRCEPIIGKYFPHLQNLQELCFGKGNIKFQYFKRTCKNLKNLKYLDIQGIENLTESDVNCISKNLLQLKVLKLPMLNCNIRHIAKLHNLALLSLYFNSLISFNKAILMILRNCRYMTQVELYAERSTEKLIAFINRLTNFMKLKNRKIYLYIYFNHLEDDEFDVLMELRTKLENFLQIGIKCHSCNELSPYSDEDSDF